MKLKLLLESIEDIEFKVYKYDELNIGLKRRLSNLTFGKGESFLYDYFLYPNVTYEIKGNKKLINFNKNNSKCVIAYNKNKIIGFAARFYEPDYSGRIDVFVSTKYRNMGVATKLIQYLKSNRNKELRVTPTDNIGKKLYSKFGFMKNNNYSIEI